jgi:Fe2+ transport system protein FeoA
VYRRRGRAFGRREDGPLTLCTAKRHTKVRVLRVAAGTRLTQRLAALGVVPGAILTVVKPHGPAVVSVGGARIAIGRGAARAVEIEVTT